MNDLVGFIVALIAVRVRCVVYIALVISLKLLLITG